LGTPAQVAASYSRLNSLAVSVAWCGSQALVVLSMG
jgi:hypothetical protein